jgi:WhiB family redox-sensing transcriptional regulator
MTEYGPARWRAAGACVSADPDLFFPVSPGGEAAGQIAQALRICGGCGVRRQCLEFALRMHEMEGIWGGTTPQERVRARRAEAERRRARRRREAARAA